MNKKFSTLTASLLFACAFSGNAEGTLVKVADVANLVPGQYVLANAAGDSVMTYDGEAALMQKKAFSVTESAPATCIVSLAKDGKNWTIKNGENTIYWWDDNSFFYGDATETTTATYTIAKASGKNDLATIKVASSSYQGSSQTVAKNSYLTRTGVAGTDGSAATFGKLVGDYSNFALYAVPAEAQEGQAIADIEATPQTFLLVVDGQYVGAAAALRVTSAVGGAIVLEDEMPENETNFTWLSENGAYKNLATGKFLTVPAPGQLALADEAPASTTIDGNALVIGGKLAGGVTLLQSSTPMPFVSDGYHNPVVEAKTNGYYALGVNGQFVWDNDGSYSFAGFNNKEFAMLWSVEKIKTGTTTVGAETKDTYKYQFKNKETGDYLTVNDRIVYAGGNVTSLSGETFLQISDTEFITSSLGVTTVKGQAATFGFVDAGSVFITAKELRAVYGDSFEMTISNPDDEAVEGAEAFTGVLKPVYYLNGSIGAISPSAIGFALANADGKLIVMDKGDKYSNVSTADYGYKFKLFTPEALRRAIIDDATRYEYDFYIEFKAGQLAADVNEVKSVYCDRNPLGLLTVNGKEYLSVGNDHYELDAVKIKLVNNNIVDPTVLLKDATFFNVSYLNSKKYSKEVSGVSLYNTILGMDDNGDAAFVAKTKTQQNKPEGQWAIQYDKDNNTYTFVNRESGVSFADELNGKFLYKTGKDNVYAYVHPAISGWENSDTISIVPVKTTEADGFARWANAMNTLYNVGVYSSVREDAVWTAENHKANHVIGLEKDVEDATAWRLDLNTYIFENQYGDEFIKVDTVYVPTELSYWHVKSATNKFWDTKIDTLKILSYSLKNQSNEETVGYDSDEKAYACNKASARFVFKEIGEQYNLIQLIETEYDKDTRHNRYTLTNARKVYGGDSANKGLLDYTSEVYDKVENDLFVVEATEAPLYRTITPFDTISIYRQENEKQLLFEDGEFLGLKNAAQFEINPAMFVDTAYVRNNTYRPQYMLMFNPDITPAGKWCEEHQSATCEHAVPTKGWVEGRYLVNLKDSAIAYEDLHVNKYVNTENYYKLGFVQATHKNDSLVIASSNDSIYVGDANYNVAKFAFRIVNNETNEFKIETANYYKLNSRYAGELNEDYPYGYIKWMNGVVVVVDDIQDADIFNLNADEEGDPTANDAISTSEVSIIAGNGVVTINGAAGKKIVISNVLGQTIANTVLSSDNATISAPAGVVVVAVEGEAAVKAIVK